MDVLLQPVIIENVFQFLPVLDIDQCQYVCQAWREFALRRLVKCPSIDKCQSFALQEYCVSNSSDNGDENIQEKMFNLIRKNRQMNQVEYNHVENLEHDYIYHWYLKRVANWNLMPKFEIEFAMRKFLTSDAQCPPRLTLIRYSKELEHAVKGNSFRYPAVLIRQEGMSCCIGKVSRDIEMEMETYSDDEKALYQRITRYQVVNCSFFEGLHVNRNIPGLKIIVTDWSDPHSPRPDADDPEFPIKAVIYLATPSDENRNRTKTIKRLLAKSKPIFSGGVLISVGDEGDPLIFLADPKNGGLKSASRITISFAGKNVKSAIHSIDTDSDFEEGLEDFKDGLKFPTDDDRVIGFLQSHHLSFCPDSVIAIISKLFPCVELIRIEIPKGPHQSKNSSDTDSTGTKKLHLIRF